MVGYPVYNDLEVSQEKTYLSDICVENGKYFAAGFVIALITAPGITFAAEPGTCQEKLLDYVPTPAPSPPGAPNGNASVLRRDIAQTLAGVAGCGAAAKKCSDLVNQGIKASADKLATANPPTVVGISVCMLLAGYCAGKVSTKAIDRYFGF